MGASVQKQNAPAIPSVTTPAKNAKPTVEPRKVVDSAAFRAAVAEARKAMDAGDFVAAEKAYAQAIAADPSNSRAQFNQGVAQYKNQNLQGSSESFAAAGQIGDPGVAESAMFNQGDAAYSGAIQIIDSDDFKKPSDPAQQDQENPKRKEAIDAAMKAASTALTHFKDAASADQLDLDARYNAEAATRLLKMLEEEKKEEEKKDQEKKEEEKKEEEKKEEGEKGDPKEDQSKDGQPKDEGQQEKDKQGKDGKKDEGDKSDQQEGKTPDKSEEKKEEKKPDESKDGKEEAPKPVEKEQKQAEGQKPGEETQGQESQTGEPVKDAPLTKQEADRLLQAVRDREKTRKEEREAKELAKPTRRTPASKDW